MDSQYTKIFERHPDENTNCLHSDSLFEEFCVPQNDKEQTMSNDSLWTLSDDSMMLFPGVDSSVHTSEASEFTSFSELAFGDNPSSIFNQSLEMFGLNGTAPPGAAVGEKQHVENTEAPRPDPENVPLESLPEFYSNPLVGGDTDASLGWSFDLFENSKQHKDEPESTLSANPEQLNTQKPKAEPMPINPPKGLLRPTLQSLPQSFSSSSHNSTDRTQPLDGCEVWSELEHTEEVRTENTQVPWEWHSFEYNKAGDSRMTTLTPASGTSLNVSHPEQSSSESVVRDQNADPTIEELSGKKERRKPKPIAKRFQPIGTVTVIPSYVQCLNIVLDYHGYTGTITQIVLNNSITNVAYQQHDSAYRASLVRKPLVEFYTVPEHEELVGNVPPGSGVENTISLISGVLQRKIHIRDIASILSSVQSIAYVKSGRFSIHNPYEPQYYRYELDAKGKAVNESKCGMCAFCPAVKFLPFKNSSYLSHMTLEHGIFASNFVVPEGLYYGRYRMVRSTDPSKTRTVKALQCPACFQVIEVACWKNKTNPLLSYFRHFKKLHSNLNKTFTSSTIDPVTLKHRGGNVVQNEQLSVERQ